MAFSLLLILLIVLPFLVSHSGHVSTMLKCVSAFYLIEHRVSSVVDEIRTTSIHHGLTPRLLLSWAFVGFLFSFWCHARCLQMECDSFMDALTFSVLFASLVFSVSVTAEALLVGLGAVTLKWIRSGLFALWIRFAILVRVIGMSVIWISYLGRGERFRRIRVGLYALVKGSLLVWSSIDLMRTFRAFRVNSQRFQHWRVPDRLRTCPICMDDDMIEPVIIGRECTTCIYCFKCAWELIESGHKLCACCRKSLILPRTISLADGSGPLLVFLCVA
jgi:hypothetical protein